MEQRIMHVIDHTGPGGAQVLLGQLLAALKGRFSFYVAVLGQSGHFSEVYRTLEIPLFELGSRGGKWSPLPVFRLADAIRRERISLLHTWLFKSHILGSLAARWTGKRLILHDHTGIYPQSLEHYFHHPFVRGLYYRLYRSALKQCTRALVLTPEDARRYSDFFSLPPQKLTVLPNGLDLARFKFPHGLEGDPSLRQELGLSREIKLVIMVGRLSPEKDWLTFLRVAQRVQQRFEQPCGFLVVGSGPEEPKLRDYAAGHNLDGVSFLGYREDIPSLLRQADVFLLTSRREVFGIVILEAMAAGCPVVTTRSGGPESILADEVDGLFADVGDVDGLSSQVLRLLRDRTLGEKIARKAQQKVVDSYSINAVSIRLADVYAEAFEE
jgi:glycosyltransferase involved in cell wall biosynthesis